MHFSKVSVVIPFYNDNDYIIATLNSIDCQTFPPREVIIVKDINSEDPIFTNFDNITVTVIENNTDRRGAGVCRWIGYNYSNFEIVAFIDSDDLWVENRLEAHIKYFDSKNLSFSFASYSNFNHDDVNNCFEVKNFSTDFTRFSFLAKLINVGCLTVIVNKSKVGNIPIPILFRRNDYEMWYYVCSKVGWDSCTYAFYPNNIAFRRLRNKSLSSNKIKALLYQYKLYKTIGASLPKSVLYMFCYIIFTLFSKFYKG